MTPGPLEPGPLEQAPSRPGGTGGGGVRVRYWAAARAAAGVAEDEVCGARLGEVMEQVRARHPDPVFGGVLRVSSLLLDGSPVGSRDPAELAVSPGSTVEVLPPFAGG